MEHSNEYSATNSAQFHIMADDDVLMTEFDMDETTFGQVAMDKELNESTFDRLFKFDPTTDSSQQQGQVTDGLILDTDENFLNGFLGLQSASELMQFNQSFNNINDSTTLGSNSARSSNEFFDTASGIGFGESPNSSNSFNSNDVSHLMIPNISNNNNNSNMVPQHSDAGTVSLSNEQKQKRFGFSNPLSNMFRSQSQRLRGLSSNKDAANVTPTTTSTAVPPQFIESLPDQQQKQQQQQQQQPFDALESIDPLETTVVVPGGVLEEPQGRLKRGTRSATNSIVSALNSAKFSFNKQKSYKLSSRFTKEEEEDGEEEGLMDQEEINTIMDKMLNMDNFKDDDDHDFDTNLGRLSEDNPRGSLDVPLPTNIRISVENIDGIRMNFDQELNRVISMASRTPSNYDFNRMNSVHSHDIDNDVGFITKQEREQELEPQIVNGRVLANSSSSSIKTAKSGSTTTHPENTATNEPNYAALFSNMNTKKRPSRSFSIGKLTLSQAKKSEDATPRPTTATPNSPGQTFHSNFLQIAELDDEEINLRTPRSSIQSSIPLMDDAQSSIDNGSSSVQQVQEQKVRGRKPTTEFDASRTFACKVCQRRFKREEHLKRHFRSLHMHEKPFNCPKCNKKFSRTDNLTQHIKTHSNDELVS